MATELQQQRRFVSVLFADLVGFTPFSESRDPEEVRDFLWNYFEKCGQIVERFGGTIDKYIGDALMAVWGAVTAQEDDAERAVRAALELVDLAGKLGAEAGDPQMAVRVGVMTGETAVGPGGNRAGLIIGDLVNTASRLQSIAEPGSVLVGETTYQLAGRGVEFEPLGEQVVKGKALPVPAYRARRLVGMIGGEGRGDLLEPPFVGRVEELRLLKDLLQATGRERRPRLVSVVGMVGVGKTRLSWELKKYVDGLVDDVYWHEGRSPAYGEGVTFWALGEMVRRRAGLTEAEDSVTARQKLRQMLVSYVPDESERARLEPRLAGLLGIEEVPSGERGELFSALRTLFERVAAGGTTVLLFEDLHWADPGLLDFIEEIPEWSRTSPILIVTLARPELFERRPGWGSGRRDFVSLHLGPLAHVEMKELITGLAPGVPEVVVSDVMERAAGVPLYAVELVRMLVSHGTLQIEDGAYRLVGDLSQMAIPESLQAVVGARLDRLDPDEREVLQWAAVLGQSFFVERLSALTGLGVADVETRLARLVRKEILQIQRDPASPERGQYAFVQALIREVAYGRLSRPDRRDRHLATARYYESFGDDELAAVVASHYLAAYQVSTVGEKAGELADLAVGALVSAAERAAALHSHEQALALVEQAFDVLPEDADQTKLLELAVTSADSAAKDELVERYGRRLLERQKARGDLSGQARAAWLVGRAFLNAQLFVRALSVLEELISSTVDLTSDPALVSAAVELSRAYMLIGREHDGALEADRALIAAESLDMIPEIAHALITKGTALAGSGRLREGSALLRGGLQLALEHDLPPAELRARSNLSAVALEDYPPTIGEMIPAGLEKARLLGDRGFELFFANWLLGWAELKGDYDRALEVMGEYPLEELPPSWALSWRGTAALFHSLRGDPKALAEADAALLSAAELEDRQTVEWMAEFHARSYAAAGRLGEAYDLSLANYLHSAVKSSWNLRTAAQAAAWLREPDRVQGVIAALEAHTGFRGRVVNGFRTYCLAALAGIEGRTEEAVAAFEELTDLWRRLDLPVQVAEAQGALALTCPQHPSAPQSAEQFRRFFLDRRATALVDLFGRLYEQAQVAA